MLIYPITIVLILLNAIPDNFTSDLTFKIVVIVTIIFSIPDLLASIGMGESVQPLLEALPLGKYSLAWLLPAITTWIIINLFSLIKRKS